MMKFCRMPYDPTVVMRRRDTLHTTTAQVITKHRGRQASCHVMNTHRLHS